MDEKRVPVLWTTVFGLAILLCASAVEAQIIPYGGQIVWSEDFEIGWGDWYADNGVWQIGEPTAGPSAAHQGTWVAATNLSGDYPFNTDSRLISPVVVLPSLAAGEMLELRFWHWFSYAETSLDHGRVEIKTYDSNGWSTWKSLAASTEGALAGWSRSAKDLTSYAGRVVRIAFCHDDTDEEWPRHRESTGWYIDEVEIWHGVPQFVNPEGFELGWADWYADNGVWQIGKPTSGPSEAYSGEYIAGTNLVGNYPFNTDSRLVMPPVTLPSLTQLPLGQMLELRFWQWFSYATDSADHGRVEIQTLEAAGWSVWKSLGVSGSGTSAGWSRMAKDLTEYAGKTVRIAFYHDDADEEWPRHREGAGWYIDDVQITPPPQTWMVSEDTGVSRTDKLTNDTTPELTFVFPSDVHGGDGDIVIRGPDGDDVVPDVISGWGTNIIVVNITTPLTEDGQYVIVLMSTITDAQGQPINNGSMKILYFTFRHGAARCYVGGACYR